MKAREKYPFTYKGRGFRLLETEPGAVCGIRIQGHSRNTIFLRDITGDLAKKEAMRMIDAEGAK